MVTLFRWRQEYRGVFEYNLHCFRREKKERKKKKKKKKKGGYIYIYIYIYIYSQI